MKIKFTGKIILLSLLLGLMQMLPAAPRDLGAFSNVRTSAARLPFYKNGRLEYYMRSQSMVMRGKDIEGVWPIIDVVRKGVSVEMIARSDSSSSFYKLGTPVDEVAKYWLNRAYSDGLIISESAVLDQVARVASSKEKVYLRSPMLDLNGVGFTADFNRNLVTVSSKVEIVLRSNGKRSLGDALKGVDKAKDPGSVEENKSESMTYIYCDELTIDGKRNVITLLGNVRVFDPAGTVTSERLELELEEKNKKTAGKSDEEKSSSGQQLKAAKFIGKVHAVRNISEEEAARGEQFADADMAVYTAHNDTLELTGSRPRLNRGKDFAEAERIVIMPEKNTISFHDKCLFKFRRDEGAAQDSEAPFDVVTSDYADYVPEENLIRLIGNVKLNAPADNADMSADRLEIELLDDEKKPAVKKDKSAVGGGQVKKVTASGKVTLLRKNNGSTEQARAGRMVYLAAADELELEDKPILQRDEDIIRGGKMVYKISEERLLVTQTSNIVLSAATVGSAQPGERAAGKAEQASASAEPVTVDSDSSDLNYGGNLVTFCDKVKVRGRGALLDCDKLEIFLENAPDKGAAKKDTADKLSGDKKPMRALASGKVHAEDKTGTLDADSLDLYFGEKAVPGKTDLEKIIASGNVHIKSKPEEGNASMVGPQPLKKKKSATLLGSSGDGTTSLDAMRGVIDLLQHTADFYENVVVKDTASKLECDHLKAIAQKTTQAVPSIESYRKRDEFPDRLAVGEDRELVRINANGNVRMSRALENGESQRAKSDYAVYDVRKRTVVMTSDAPRRPQAVTADSGMIGDKVTIELDTEDIYVDNGDILARMND